MHHFYCMESCLREMSLFFPLSLELRLMRTLKGLIYSWYPQHKIVGKTGTRGNSISNLLGQSQDKVLLWARTRQVGS